ncbi:hypothetical protein BC1_00051 [Bacillus phage BC-1]|nr:hypothetical protein BC1_00051 [Bacillus phage BC-1]
MMEKEHYNQEAEEAVLGAIFQEGSLLQGTIIEETHLFFEQHRILLVTMKELHEKELPIEIIQVVESLRRKGQLEVVGGLPFVAHISECVPNIANFKHHENIVLEHWKTRASIEESVKFQRAVAIEKKSGEGTNHLARYGGNTIP